MKYIVIFVLVFTLLAGGRVNLVSVPQCGNSMVYVPGGTFLAGATKREVDYITHLCNKTVGGCYKTWFENEIPRRVVKFDSFCMDKYEYPNREGQYPKGGVSFGIAKAMCIKEKKRLCNIVEWEQACLAGMLGNIWTYGYVYREGVCNDNSGGLLPSGYNRGCKSTSGIYDLTGNIAEWVEGSVGKESGGRVLPYNILKGGSYRDRPIFSRCNYLNLQERKLSYGEFGFRCCDDTALQKARRAEPAH